MNWLLSLLGAGVIERFTQPLLAAYQAKLAASNSEAKLEAESDIARLENLRAIAVAEATDRWSATRIGRLLIVVPFGIWWATIYLIQIINPLFGVHLVVINVPPHIHQMALVLVPAIVLADAGAFIARVNRR